MYYRLVECVQEDHSRTVIKTGQFVSVQLTESISLTKPEVIQKGLQPSNEGRNYTSGSSTHV